MSKYSYVLFLITLFAISVTNHVEGFSPYSQYNNTHLADSLVTIDTTKIADDVLVIREIIYFNEVILNDTSSVNGKLQIKKILVEHTTISPLDTIYLQEEKPEQEEPSIEQIAEQLPENPSVSNTTAPAEAIASNSSDEVSNPYSSNYYFGSIYEPEPVVVAEATGEPMTEVLKKEAIESAPASRAGLPGAKVLERRAITPEEAYDLTLTDIEKRRKMFAKDLLEAKSDAQKQQVLKSAATFLEESIAIDVVHYWYGTSFDKEGMSKNPNEGKIACSYFITTVLRDAGLKVNRIKLAQQSAQNIAKTLCNNNQMKRLTTPEQVKNYVQKKGKGLYVIGFSFHVGFLYNDGLDTYLIHASPLPPGTVARLPMQGARSFDYSKFYDVGKLSDNKTLIQKWLKGERIY